jgi:hypothetical protein
MTPEKDKRNDLWYEAEVNAVMPAKPQFMQWSEAAITWGREDHPRLMPSPGEYALVLDPVMCSDTHTCRFSCVLIDGGSSINLPYRSSMEKLGISLAQLKPSQLTFDGIVSGHSCAPMGRVQLEVLFGKKGNSCRDPSSSRWWTSAVLTMRCLAVQPWPSSWRCRTMPISR